MFGGDDGAHHVEAGDAAGAGEAAAVDLVQACAGCRVAESPRGTPPCAPSGWCSEIRPAVPRAPEYRGRRRRRRSARRAAPASAATTGCARCDEAPDCRRRRPESCRARKSSPTVLSAAIARPLDASHRPTLRRDMNPFVERPAGQPVGRAQRFDRRGVGQQREAREQQEADLAGRRGVHAGRSFVRYQSRSDGAYRQEDVVSGQ